MPSKLIDLRSDLVSQPSNELWASLDKPSFGVDDFGEDHETSALEAYVADLCGMDAALFFPTGVMANLTAVINHTPKNHEVIVGKKSHIFAHEAGGVSILGGVPMQTIDDGPGVLDSTAMQESIS